ncbi:cytochrome b/b6 domain-containing protein [Pelomicrobium methylotrophicum]|uniref:Cytochrome B n=1 Tax=Pelomicrobium methylotrophicum TaxID=2602750 RepID=A0A5C7EKH0_9PROT|nr:cytochrome b/b6 domain-containing protein [Pelomicrobium methylotrophicum]TXF11854.1 cytochrome B [Pelomicrobium methylotrophicum]
MNRVLIWDWPVRVGHWFLVAGFGLAWITGDSERWRLVHGAVGGAMVGVVLFRLLWGFVGTRHARFADFVRGPRAAAAHLRGLLALRPEYTAGHNPAGGFAILALLAFILLTGATGWFAYQDAGEWAGELHETLAHALLLLVFVHLAGVLVGSAVLGENLVRAMLDGRKRARPEAAIPSARAVAVPLLLAAAAAGAWWFVQ